MNLKRQFDFFYCKVKNFNIGKLHIPYFVNLGLRSCTKRTLDERLFTKSTAIKVERGLVNVVVYVWTNER